MNFYYKAKKNENGQKYFVICANNKKEAEEKLKKRHINPTGQIGEYLNEAKLYFILSKLFNNLIVGKRFYYNPERPKSYYEADFIVEINNKKTIIEFDGIFHYTRLEDCINDINKDEFFKNEGYHIIRIPYFIQLSKDDNIINNLFNKDYPFKDKYSHGFIDINAPLPTDFCGLGLKRFMNELNSDMFNPAKKSIIKSIRDKMKYYNNIYPDFTEENLYLTVIHNNNELIKLIRE